MNERRPLWGPARTPEQNPQTIVNRHAQASDTESATRQKRLYPALTLHGLVAVRAASDLTAMPAIDVLVITPESVATARHRAYRSTLLPTVASTPEYTSLLLGDRQHDPGGLSFKLNSDEARRLGYAKLERLRKIRASVFRALEMLADCAAAYDALHQAHAYTYPLTLVPGDDNYGFEGEPYGPRVNFEVVLRADRDRMHPAVLEAADNMPDLVVAQGSTRDENSN